MKTLSYILAIGVALFILSATPAQCQEDYSFVANAWEPQVVWAVGHHRVTVTHSVYATDR